MHKELADSDVFNDVLFKEGAVRKFENPQSLERLGSNYLGATDDSIYAEFQGEVKQFYIYVAFPSPKE